MVLFLEYPKCRTCKKVKKWLEEHQVEYTDRHIIEEN
ncbi:MAG: glutaredoxin domain-containing protein, partial [Blautia sp.]